MAIRCISTQKMVEACFWLFGKIFVPLQKFFSNALIGKNGDFFKLNS